MIWGGGATKLFLQIVETMCVFLQVSFWSERNPVALTGFSKPFQEERYFCALCSARSTVSFGWSSPADDTCAPPSLRASRAFGAQLSFAKFKNLGIWFLLRKIGSRKSLWGVLFWWPHSDPRQGQRWKDRFEILLNADLQPYSRVVFKVRPLGGGGWVLPATPPWVWTKGEEKWKCL